MAIKTICHLLAAVCFWFGCYYDWNYVKIPPEVHPMGESFGRSKKLKFLTFWDALLQATFFTICFLNDIIGTNEETPRKPPLIRKVKDLIFVCLAFPYAVMVSTTFWVIYFYDRDLIFPEVFECFIPSWLNHLEHTAIIVWIDIELVTSCREYPYWYIGLPICLLLAVVYIIWMHILFHYTCSWAYPIFDDLSDEQRYIFLGMILLYIAMLYFTGEMLNNYIWRKYLDAAECFRSRQPCNAIASRMACRANASVANSGASSGKKCGARKKTC